MGILFTFLTCYTAAFVCGSKKVRVCISNARAIIFAGILTAIALSEAIITGINFSKVMTLQEYVNEWKKIEPCADPEMHFTDFQKEELSERLVYASVTYSSGVIAFLVTLVVFILHFMCM